MTTAAQWNDRVRRRLKLRDVDILLAVIRTGSMGKAAGALNMSQPAVSKAIAYLENTLGVRLLDRSRQGVEPTPYGRALIKRGVAMFDELRQGVEDIASLTDPTMGEVRMGGSEHTISAIYSPVVHRLSARYPRMSFHIIVGDLQTMSRELDARNIDFVVSRMYSPPSEEHAIEVLFEDPLVVVTGPKNPLARRRKIEPAELLKEPWTLQPRENNFGAFARDALRAAGLAPPQINVATTSSNLRGEMLATGRYLSIVPRYWVLLPRRHPSLRVLPVEFPNTRLNVAIITLKNRSLSRATELFIDGVRALTKPLAPEK
ncbi:MAG TPA: LysR family transcriptional regulator [Xanthobacteraceae bacterium]|jgi:DNA-binding transcriptional LysR family regulator